MGVAAEQKLDIPKLKSELGDIAFDLRSSFDKSAIEHKVALWGSDQERGHLVGSDVVYVT